MNNYPYDLDFIFKEISEIEEKEYYENLIDEYSLNEDNFENLIEEFLLYENDYENLIDEYLLYEKEKELDLKYQINSYETDHEYYEREEELEEFFEFNYYDNQNFENQFDEFTDNFVNNHMDYGNMIEIDNFSDYIDYNDIDYIDYINEANAQLNNPTEFLDENNYLTFDEFEDDIIRDYQIEYEINELDEILNILEDDFLFYDFEEIDLESKIEEQLIFEKELKFYFEDQINYNEELDLLLDMDLESKIEEQLVSEKEFELDLEDQINFYYEFELDLENEIKFYEDFEIDIEDDFEEEYSDNLNFLEELDNKIHYSKNNKNEDGEDLINDSYFYGDMYKL